MPVAPPVTTAVFPFSLFMPCILRKKDRLDSEALDS
jgi:hypothetical protein